MGYCCLIHLKCDYISVFISCKTSSSTADPLNSFSLQLPLSLRRLWYWPKMWAEVGPPVSVLHECPTVTRDHLKTIAVFFGEACWIHRWYANAKKTEIWHIPLTCVVLAKENRNSWKTEVCNGSPLGTLLRMMCSVSLTLLFHWNLSLPFAKRHLPFCQGLVFWSAS